MARSAFAVVEQKPVGLGQNLLSTSTPALHGYRGANFAVSLYPHACTRSIGMVLKAHDMKWASTAERASS